jgi:hypothetical protein
MNVTYYTLICTTLATEIDHFAYGYWLFAFLFYEMPATVFFLVVLGIELKPPPVILATQWSDVFLDPVTTDFTGLTGGDGRCTKDKG